MIRFRLVVLLAGVAASPLLAQDPAGRPARPAGPGRPTPPAPQSPILQGEAKLRYLAQQAMLDDAQKTAVDGLITQYKAKIDERKQEFTPDKVSAMSQEIQQLTREGKQAEAEAKRKELQAKVGNQDLEEEFFTSLESSLNAEQKARLATARKRLEENPSGGLSPYDVIRIARELSSSAEQKSRLDALAGKFRKEINATPSPDTGARLRMLDTLIADVRATLPPEQHVAFDARIEVLWSDAQRSMRQQMQSVGPVAPTSAPAPLHGRP